MPNAIRHGSDGTTFPLREPQVYQDGMGGTGIDFAFIVFSLEIRSAEFGRVTKITIDSGCLAQ